MYYTAANQQNKKLKFPKNVIHPFTKARALQHNVDKYKIHGIYPQH